MVFETIVSRSRFPYLRKLLSHTQIMVQPSVMVQQECRLNVMQAVGCKPAVGFQAGILTSV